MYSCKMVVVGETAYRYWYLDGRFVRRELMREGNDPRDPG